MSTADAVEEVSLDCTATLSPEYQAHLRDQAEQREWQNWILFLTCVALILYFAWSSISQRAKKTEQLKWVADKNKLELDSLRATMADVCRGLGNHARAIKLLQDQLIATPRKSEDVRDVRLGPNAKLVRKDSFEELLGPGWRAG